MEYLTSIEKNKVDLSILIQKYAYEMRNEGIVMESCIER